MKLYTELRAEMVRADLGQEDVANALNVSRSHISLLMIGRAQWRADQMYKVLDLLDLPDEDLGRLFPRDGKRSRRKSGILKVV